MQVIEECPSPFVHQRPGMREKIVKCAVAYASKLKYKSAGTVEFLVDDTTGDFFFLEMNTRLQVEHGITELCYGVDLVALMLQQADYEKGGETGLPSAYLYSLQKDGPDGAAIEGRVYAEVPYRNYAPSPGQLQAVEWPTGQGIRVDTWVQTGQRIAPFYGKPPTDCSKIDIDLLDPLIAKVMVHAANRTTAGEKMLSVLTEIKLQGPATNLHFLKDVIASKRKIPLDSNLQFVYSIANPPQPLSKETLSLISLTRDSNMSLVP
jgi:urea carboxylase